MKKLLFIISFFIIGCTWQQLDTTLDILDIIAGDEVVHSGVVEIIVYDNESTTVYFKDGIAYRLKRGVCCPVVGQQWEIFSNDLE